MTDKENYQNMLNILKKTVLNINDALDNIEMFKKKIKEAISINDSVTYKGSVDNIKDNLLIKKNKINHVIIPEIESKINN